MPDETDNKAFLEYEARINEASFEAAELRAKESATRVGADAKASTRAAEREQRNIRKLNEESSKEETAILKTQQLERDRIRKEAAAIANVQLNDQQRAFRDASLRETQQVREAAAIRKTMRDDEAKHAKTIQLEKDRIAKESAAIAKVQQAEQERAFAAQVTRENTKALEAAAIRRQMRADELKAGIKPDRTKLRYDIQQALEAEFGPQIPIADYVRRMSAQKEIEKAGFEYKGKQSFGGTSFHSFNDPISGTTLSLEGDITQESIRRKVAESRKKWGIEDKIASEEELSRARRMGVTVEEMRASNAKRSTDNTVRDVKDRTRKIAAAEKEEIDELAALRARNRAEAASKAPKMAAPTPAAAGATVASDVADAEGLAAAGIFVQPGHRLYAAQAGAREREAAKLASKTGKKVEGAVIDAEKKVASRAAGASSFATRRAIADVGTVFGESGAGSIASLAAFGPLYAGIAAGIGVVAIAVLSVRQAIADSKAELSFAANIRTIGQAYSDANLNALQFKATALANRAEAYTLAAAFGSLRAANVVTTSADISKVATIGTARGQTPEETAKVLEAIAKGNKEVFEAETGLKARVVIDEYARAQGKLPSALLESAKAQALYNKYLEQSLVLGDLSEKQINSASGKWTRFKNTITDVLGGFGEATLTAFGEKNLLHRQDTSGYEPLLRALGFDLPESVQLPKKEERAAAAEVARQAALNIRYQQVGITQTEFFKDFGRSSSGKTTLEQYKELIAANEAFKESIHGLDKSDEELVKIADDYESKIAPAINQARQSILALREENKRNLGELAGGELAGQQNPYAKMFSDLEDAASKAHEKYKVYGADVEAYFTKIYQSEANAALFQQRITDNMKAMDLEFEAARLSKPFIELTGEMKRMLSVLDAEVKGAVAIPGLLAQANVIELGGRARGYFRGFGFNVPGVGIDPRTGQPAVSQDYIAGQEYSKLMRLKRERAGLTGIEGDEASHAIDVQLTGLYNRLSPAARLQVSRQPAFARDFAGAFRGEAGYADNQIKLAAQRADISRQSVVEAQIKLRQLAGMPIGQGPEAEGMRNAVRAEVLAITGALPREDLTGDLLKGRIDALKEEAVHKRQAEDAAIQAVMKAEQLQTMLNDRLTALLKAVGEHNESVILKVLDDTNRTRISTLGPAMENKPETGPGAADAMRSAMNLGGGY